MQKKTRENIEYVMFVGVAVVIFISLMFAPILLGLYNSFTDYDGLKSVSNFVGMANYKKVFTNENFINSIGFTLKYTVVTVILSNGLGIMIAMALNKGLKMQSILRIVFVMPMMIGLVTVGFLWKFILNNFVPYVGESFGIEALQSSVLSQAGPTFWAICLIAVWNGVGYMMLLYLSGLQSIPADYYEAAAIDGANAWQRFRYIIVPLLRPTMVVCIFMTLVNGMKVYDLPYALTQGGPYGTTQSMAYNIYQEAFTRGNYPLATAESFVFCIFVAVIGILQNKAMNRKES